jgi:hypothetical protein
MITNKRPDPLQPTEDSVVFAAEASELGWPVGKFQVSFMVYGAEFIHVKTERDNDGDVMYWLYYANSIGKHAKIFND